MGKNFFLGAAAFGGLCLVAGGLFVLYAIEKIDETLSPPSPKIRDYPITLPRNVPIMERFAKQQAEKYKFLFEYSNN